MEYNYLLSLCAILLSTKIFSLLSRRAQLPQVVGALMAGLLFGPAVLGAKLCGFNNRESYQVGFGMVCCGEVALIVANKGVAMHMIATEYIGPIIIMIIICSIITPILLKAAFRGRDDEAADLTLSHRLERADQVDSVTHDLLRSEHQGKVPVLSWKEEASRPGK